jgi:uncharacterized protein DUF4389
MVKKPKKTTEEDVEPTVLEEPGSGEQASEVDWRDDENNVWLRGLWMLVLALLFGIGEFVLGVAAILQFLWLLFGKEKNQPIADFGKDLSDWLAKVALFQTGATDAKPFPFSKWGKD